MNKYIDRLKAIKLNIVYYRKQRGLSQDKLSEKLNISRTHLSRIESPNIAQGITLEMLFEIADALEIDPTKLLEIR